MKCKNCQEGWQQYHHVDYVTHDMALDAGDPDLEGEAWDWGYEWIRCQCCGGEFEDCPVCSLEKEEGLTDE